METFNVSEYIILKLIKKFKLKLRAEGFKSMKHSFNYKNIYLFLAIFLIANASAKKITNSTNKYINYLSRNSEETFRVFDIKKHAINTINEIKEKDNPYKALVTYAPLDSNTLRVQTKKLYTNYRRKADVSVENIKINTSAFKAEEVKFIYNPKKDKNHAIQITTNTKSNTKLALNKRNSKIRKF